MSEIPESKKPRKSIGRNIVDEWDLKHFKRVPVANSSFQYEIREDLIKMIDSEIEQLQKQNKELIEALKFYADGDNWGYIAPDKVDYRVIEKSDFGIGEFQLTELTDDEWVGGRRAREVINKYVENYYETKK